MNNEGRMMKDDDFKLLRGFGDRQTNGRTFVNVESLSRLKIPRLFPISAWRGERGKTEKLSFVKF